MFGYHSIEVANKLMRYVQIDTQSDPHSQTFPSTQKQKELSQLLVQELIAMGITDATMDEWGYVMATIPSNSTKNVPVICFCAHVDTAPDCSGANVKPLLHRNYNGADIILPDDPTQIITTKTHPYLLKKIGEDIITASGTTLLGADDKAGVAIIMEFASHLMQHPQIKHGNIRILFTPDEEVGRGVNYLNMEKLGAHIGYTLDGGERGTLEAENFSADSATVTFHGISAHPGDAKNKLVNALKLVALFIDSLPKNVLCPENTELKEGFIHPVHMEGIAEKATVQFILRDFDTANLASYATLLRNKMNEVIALFPGATATIEIKEQYRNMHEVLVKHPLVIEYAIAAMKNAGVDPIISSIRGGTDGARLSYMGLPCPNLFTGEMALHGKQEYVSVQDMQKSVDTLIELVQIWEAKS